MRPACQRGQVCNICSEEDVDRYKAALDVNGRNVQRYCWLAAEQKVSEYGSRDLAEVLVTVVFVISKIIDDDFCNHDNPLSSSGWSTLGSAGGNLRRSIPSKSSTCR